VSPCFESDTGHSGAVEKKVYLNLNSEVFDTALSSPWREGAVEKKVYLNLNSEP